MALELIYTLDCHCGSDATLRSLDLSNPQPDGTVRIDIELAAGQSDFECGSCGCVTGTGDLYREVAVLGTDCDGEDDLEPDHEAPGES